MSRLTVKVEGINEAQARFKSAPTSITETFFTAMVEVVTLVKNRAQDIVAYKTGTLRRSIQERVENNGFRGIVYQDASIAPYGESIEKGRRALTIYPKTKKALYWHGAPHPMRSVNQPARAARPFMAPALEYSLPQVRSIFQKATATIARRLAGGSL